MTPRDSRRYPLLRTLSRVWRRALLSPARIVWANLSPRRLIRRVRLRWVVLFSAALCVWAVATLTEPAATARTLPGAPTAESPAAGRSPSAPRDPSPPQVRSSPEAAARFFRKVAGAARSGLRTGRVDLSVSDIEATSALDVGAQLTEIAEIMSTLSPEELEELDTPEEVRQALDARDREAASGLFGRVRHALSPRLRFRRPRVRFRPDGRVSVSGYVQAWSRRVPVYVDAVPALDEGRLRLRFQETRLGSVPVPAWVVGGPSNLLTLLMGLGRDYVWLEALEVGDGRLSLSGRLELSPGR